MLVANGGGLEAQAGPSLQGLHDRLLRDRSLQFDFADIRPPPVPQIPAWLRNLAQVFSNGFTAAFPVLKVVFLTGVAVAVGLLIFVIGRELLGADFMRRRKPKAAKPTPADWRPDARKARALLENADRLAAQGRFDLAVRLILHRGIEDIDDRRPRLVRPAFTARELAGRPELPGAARQAFAKMAAIVEFSAFAGHPIGRPAFDDCRAAYEAFAFPEAWK